MPRLLRATILFPFLTCAPGIPVHIHAAPGVSATTKVVSGYVFRGLQLSGAALQPAIDFVANDFNAGISSNIPIESRSSDQPGAELDVYASYRFALNANTHLTPGVAAYFYRHAPTRSGYRRAVFEPNLAFGHTFAAVRFTSMASYDIVRRGAAIDLTGDVALPLTKLGTELDLAASVGGYRLRDAVDSRQSRTRSDGKFWSLSAVVPFQVTVASRLQVGLSYTAAFDAELKSATGVRGNPLAARRWVADLGYRYSF